MQISQETVYSNVLRDLSRKNNEPEFMQKFRVQSLENFNNLPWPEFKYGKGIILDARDLDFNVELGSFEINFKNLNDKIEVLDFKDAFSKHSNFISSNFMSLIINNEDKFNALHGALFDISKLIIIKDNTKLDKPLMIENIFDGSY